MQEIKTFGGISINSSLRGRVTNYWRFDLPILNIQGVRKGGKRLEEGKEKKPRPSNFDCNGMIVGAIWKPNSCTPGKTQGREQPTSQETNE